MENKTVAVIVIVVIIILLIAYAVTLFIMYDKKTVLFEPYVPVVPSNACQPLISVTLMSPEEIKARNEKLNAAKPPKS